MREPLHADDSYTHRPGHVNLHDCTGHTVPADQLSAFLYYCLGDGGADNATNLALNEAAAALAADSAQPLALAVVKALGLDEVLNERTAVLYACWVLEGRPGYIDDVPLTDRGYHPRGTDPDKTA